MIFAYTQLVLCLAASATYFHKHDIWHGVYWLFAAGITLAATRMKG